MQPSQQELEIRTGTIVARYNESGPKDAPPVIFIHGFPFDKSMWDGQLDALGDKNRCIAYDIRGYGQTESGDEDFSIELFADDLDRFMDLMQIPQAVICGLSMGGYIALRAYEKYPGRFRGMILCDTQCIADTPEGKEKRYKTIEQIESSGLNEYAEGSIKNLFSENSLQNKKPVVEEIKNTILGSSPQSIIQTLKALANRTETCSTLSDVNIPVLIICGSDDKITPPVRAEFLNQNISGSKLMIINGAGHLTPLEQPEEFNGAVKNFLNGIG